MRHPCCCEPQDATILPAVKRAFFHYTHFRTTETRAAMPPVRFDLAEKNFPMGQVRNLG
jgi:hypothetical protein